VYRQGSPAETRTPTEQNMTGRSMIDWPPVLSPNGILLPPSSHCPVIYGGGGKYCCSKMSLMHTFYFFKVTWNCLTLNYVSQGLSVVAQKFNLNNNNTKANNFSNKKFSCMSSARKFSTPLMKQGAQLISYTATR
jgi:hypothetical protein